jgi:predicted nucleotidyltransferase
MGFGISWGRIEGRHGTIFVGAGIKKERRMNDKIIIPKEKIADFCHRHSIRRLGFFGSILRNDFRSESDVDVLVEFNPDAKVGFFKLYDLEQELSRILGGRKVDINTPKSLSKYFRDQVLAEVEVQYVQA